MPRIARLATIVVFTFGLGCQRSVDEVIPTVDDLPSGAESVEIDAIGIGTIVSTRPPATAKKPIRTATGSKVKPIVLPKATRSMAEVRAAGRWKSSLLGETTQSLRSGGLTPKPKLAAFKAHVAPAITKTCVQCHGPYSFQGNTL